MNETIFIGLINNTALLLALGLIYDILYRGNRPAGSTFYQLASGLFIGGMAIMLMVTPVRWESGIIFDTRTILLGVASLFFSTFSALIAMTVSAAYRLYLDGAGALAGVATITSSCLTGLIWRHYRCRRSEELSLAELYIFGLVIHAGMLLCMLLLPPELIRNFFTNLALPVIIIYPLATVLLGRLLATRQRRFLVEQELLKSEEEFKAIANYAASWEAWFDSHGNLKWMNPYSVKLTGYTPEEFIATEDFLSMAFAEEDRAMVQEKFQEAINGSSGDNLEIRCLRKDGSRFWVSVSWQPIIDAQGRSLGFRTSAQNVTERRLLEEQLRQSQKMEAVGQLAGGVAHDFNNILSVIMGYSGLLQMDSSLNPQQQEKVDHIVKASEKAAQLTGGLLAFSRKQALTQKNVNLNDIVQQLQKFLVRVIGEDVRLKTIVHEVDLPVFIDSGQIEQALINLATNARDAMPQGGLLTIETGLQELDDSFTHLHGYGKAGSYALITVSDTGMGMDEEMRKKIFEPFFTTKETGKGTGLGLAIVYGIIKQHNGFINLYSEPDKGSTFRIYLPLLSGSALPAEEKVASVAPAGGNETILVVEDELEVRKLVAGILTEYGYGVILAEDGEEAVRQFAVNCDSVRLVLMDMIMPKMSGQAAAVEIRKLQPVVKILFTSGYTADFIKDRGGTEEGVELIMKPVQPMELLRKVREMLDR